MRHLLPLLRLYRRENRIRRIDYVPRGTYLREKISPFVSFWNIYSLSSLSFSILNCRYEILIDDLIRLKDNLFFISILFWRVGIFLRNVKKNFSFLFKQFELKINQISSFFVVDARFNLFERKF